MNLQSNRDILNAYIVAAPEKEKIQAFLRDHQYLLPVLTGAVPAIRGVYPDAGLRLDILQERQREKLRILIETSIAPDDAVTKMIDLDNDWWLDVMPMTQGMVTVDLYGFPAGNFCDD